VSEEEWEPNP